MSPAVAVLLLAIGYGDFFACTGPGYDFVDAQRNSFDANELAAKICVLRGVKHVAKADYYQIPKTRSEIFVGKEGFEGDGDVQRVVLSTGSHIAINTGKNYPGINGQSLHWRLFSSYHAPNFDIKGGGMAPIPQRPSKRDAITTGGPAVSNFQCRELEIGPDLRLANFSCCENCCLGSSCRSTGIVPSFLGGIQREAKEDEGPNAKAKGQDSRASHNPLGRSIAQEFIIRLAIFFGLGLGGIAFTAYRAWGYLHDWRRHYGLLLLAITWYGLLFYLLIVRFLLRLG